MKKKIVGISDVYSYTDKKTGMQKNAISLYFIGQSDRVFGFKSSDQFIGESSPFYYIFFQAIQMRVVNQMINQEVRVSYNESGFLDEFEFINPIPFLEQMKPTYSQPIDFPFEESSSVQNSSIDDKNKTSIK